jgi:hypothetical protein
MVRTSTLPEVTSVNSDSSELSRFASQIFVPGSPNLRNFEKTFSGGYTVKILKGSKPITTYRFLLAKIVYDESGLSIDDLLALLEIHNRLEVQATKDKEFSSKYREWLITTTGLVRILCSQVTFPIRVDGKFQKTVVEHLKPYLPSLRAFEGYRKDQRIVRGYRIILRNPLLPPKKLPPKAFIGVGPKDKGSKREPATDGSPSWQEVAMDRRESNRSYISLEEYTDLVQDDSWNYFLEK